MYTETREVHFFNLRSTLDCDLRLDVLERENALHEIPRWHGSNTREYVFSLDCH